MLCLKHHVLEEVWSSQPKAAIQLAGLNVEFEPTTANAETLAKP